jgi:hypothetical protein
MKTKTQEVNPFGRVHDYISVSLPSDKEALFVVSDGTTTLTLTELNISTSCNWSKPFRLNGPSGCFMLITYIQLEKLLNEVLRYWKTGQELA